MLYFNNFLPFLCDYMYFMNFNLRETNINLNLNYLIYQVECENKIILYLYTWYIILYR